MNYVYSHSNVLVTTITPPADLKKDAAFPITVKADWLVCSMEQCVPESATVTLPLTIGAGAADPDTGYRIAAARAALPKPVEWAATWAKQGDRLVLAVPFGSPDKVTTVTDVWTFARDVSSRDPNWKLVATEAGQ